jgi:hypothetical protein
MTTSVKTTPVKAQVTTKIGEFQVTGATIIVSDPSYKKSHAGTQKPSLANLSKMVSRAKRGTWSGYTLTNPGKNSRVEARHPSRVEALHRRGSRVWSLIAMHNDYQPSDLKKWVSIGDVAVDSGMMGIFDMRRYPEDVREEDFYEEICKVMERKKATIWSNMGVISSSGMGDGSYPANKCVVDKYVVAIQVDF